MLPDISHACQDVIPPAGAVTTVRDRLAFPARVNYDVQPLALSLTRLAREVDENASGLRAHPLNLSLLGSRKQGAMSDAGIVSAETQYPHRPSNPRELQKFFAGTTM